jgi:hypothetical protein
MKNIFLITITSLIVIGCAVPQRHPPVTKVDQFDCDQKCGTYNRTIGIIESAICVNKCLDSKGYIVK